MKTKKKSKAIKVPTRGKRMKKRVKSSSLSGTFLGGHTWQKGDYGRTISSIVYDNDTCKCQHGKWYHQNSRGPCDFIHCGCKRFNQIKGGAHGKKIR